KVLNSDDLAERVIRQLDLDHVAEFRPAGRFWTWGKKPVSLQQASGPGSSQPTADPALAEAVLDHFQANLDIKPVRRSRAVEITFDSLDPKLAGSVVNSVAANYMQKNLEARWDAAQKASEWLSQQLVDLKSKLEKSEDAMQRYAAENGLLILETGNGTSESIMNQSLRELQEELNNAQNLRYQKESLYRLVQSGNTDSLPGVLDDKLMQDLNMRLADAQREHAQLSATFTEDYPRVAQTKSEIVEIQAALDRERQRAVQKISDDYFAALRQEKLLEQAFAEKAKGANVVAEKSVQYGILQRDVESNKSLYEGLLQQLKEADVSAGLKASNIRIIDPGKTPYLPVAPNIALNLGLAAALGLGVGVAAAFFQEHLDQTIQDANDVDQYLHVPALAFIPSLESLRALRHSGLDAADRGYTFRLTDPKETGHRSLIVSRPRKDGGAPSPAALSEAFRELRTSLLLSGASHSAHSILVTSAQKGEGKTTVAMNLALSLAQLGRRTLLVDADLRSPDIHRHFPKSDSDLARFLSGEGAWHEMVRRTPVNGLEVICGGPIPSNPAELLSSDAMRTLIEEASAAYRFVILDSPPLLNVADSRILASLVDSTVLVVKCGDTPRQVVQFAESQAHASGANLLGVVLNCLDVRTTVLPYRAYTHAKSAPAYE
ncbi:MAG: GumC family protein, partial [Candidatus Acidiferrales bacterium]